MCHKEYLWSPARSERQCWVSANWHCVLVPWKRCYILLELSEITGWWRAFWVRRRKRRVRTGREGLGSQGGGDSNSIDNLHLESNPWVVRPDMGLFDSAPVTGLQTRTPISSGCNLPGGMEKTFPSPNTLTVATVPIRSYSLHFGATGPLWAASFRIGP